MFATILFAESSDFQIYLLAILSFRKHRPNATRTYLTACSSKQSFCSRMEDQSIIALILHQVSSIFSGSGNLDRYSRDTMKTVCTSRPRGGFYGRRHRRSRPASRLRRKGQDQILAISICECNQRGFKGLVCSKKKCFSCFLNHRDLTPGGAFV